MSLVDVLNAEARLLFDRDEDEHAPSLLLKAAARIRELEHQLETAAQLRRSDIAVMGKLEAQIAAHEKVCIGSWASCSQRLPKKAGHYKCEVEFRSGATAYTEVWYGGAWDDQQCGFTVTHWLDAKEPQP